MAAEAIYTIGHGRRRPEDLLVLLQRHQIAWVVDIRSHPYSRIQPAFSRERLAAFLETNGLRYMFLGDLLGGRPNDPACYGPDGRLDYQQYRQTPTYQQGIVRLRLAWDKGLRLALLCSENDLRSAIVPVWLGRVSLPWGFRSCTLMSEGCFSLKQQYWLA